MKKKIEFRPLIALLNIMFTRTPKYFKILVTTPCIYSLTQLSPFELLSMCTNKAGLQFENQQELRSASLNRFPNLNQL